MSTSTAALSVAKSGTEPHRLAAGRRPRKTVPFRSPASRTTSTSVSEQSKASGSGSSSSSGSASGSGSSTKSSNPAQAPVVITSHPSFLFTLPDNVASSSSDKDAVTPPEHLAISPALHSLIFALRNDRYPGAPGTSLHKAHQEVLKAEAAAKREAAKLLAARKEWERLGINGLGKKRKSSSPYASGMSGLNGTGSGNAEQPSGSATSAKRSRTAGAIDPDTLPVPPSTNGSSSGSRSRKPASRGASPVPLTASVASRNASPDSVSGRSTRARRNGAGGVEAAASASASGATTPAPGAAAAGPEGAGGGVNGNGNGGSTPSSSSNGSTPGLGHGHSHLNGHAPIPVHSSPLARNAAVTVSEEDSK